MNDMAAFDLNQLQMANNRWEMLMLNTDPDAVGPGKVPAPRTNHTVVSFNDKMYLYVLAILSETRLIDNHADLLRVYVQLWRYQRPAMVQRCLVL